MFSFLLKLKAIIFFYIWRCFRNNDLFVVLKEPASGLKKLKIDYFTKKQKFSDSVLYKIVLNDRKNNNNGLKGGNRLNYILNGDFFPHPPFLNLSFPSRKQAETKPMSFVGFSNISFDSHWRGSDRNSLRCELEVIRRRFSAI